MTAVAVAAPGLPKVRLTADVRVDIELDMVAFYQRIGANASLRRAYLHWTSCEECGTGRGGELEGCAPEVKPWHYLLDEFAQDIVVDTGFLPVRAGGVVVNDRTDVDEVEGSLDRPGRWSERQFTQQDFDTLVAAVPWLAPIPSEDAAEIARTTPGPLDQPLFDVEGGEA